MNDLFFMEKALSLAKKAYELGEVPVGCVIVKDGRIIGKGYNKKEKDKIATSHAEIIAIQKACKKLKDWRLERCILYVTLEPCVMCAGAIKEARIEKVFFGAYDKKNGYSLSLNNLIGSYKIFDKSLEEESITLLKNFFKNLRRGAGVDERGGLENR